MRSNEWSGCEQRLDGIPVWVMAKVYVFQYGFYHFIIEEVSRCVVRFSAISMQPLTGSYTESECTEDVDK